MTVSLSELINHLKMEIVNSQRTDSGKMFKLVEATITARVGVTTSNSAEGQLSLYVLTVGGEGGEDLEHTQEITIKLVPMDDADLWLGEG